MKTKKTVFTCILLPLQVTYHTSAVNRYALPSACRARIDHMTGKVAELKGKVKTAFIFISRANSEIVINASTEEIDGLKASKLILLESQQHSAFTALDLYIATFEKEYSNTNCSGMKEPIGEDLKHHDKELSQIIKPKISEMMSIRSDIRTYKKNLVPPLIDTKHNEAVGSVLHVLIKNRFAEYCHRVKVKKIAPYTNVIQANMTALALQARAVISSRDMTSQMRESLNAFLENLYQNTATKVRQLDFCVIPGWKPAKGDHEITVAVEENIPNYEGTLKAYVWKYVTELKTVCEQNV